MGYENHYAGIDDYAARLIKHKAKQLVGKYGFTEPDREDLEQEMVLDLLHRLPNYDPQRARRTTFIARVVEHKVATLIEAQKAGKRDYRLCDCSLNDDLEDEDGEKIERHEIIDQEDYFLKTGRISRSHSELQDLSVDVTNVISNLPLDLQTLCVQLQSKTVTEISRDNGVPRSTIYESLKKLKASLEEAGLREYL